MFNNVCNNLALIKLFYYKLIYLVLKFHILHTISKKGYIMQLKYEIISYESLSFYLCKLRKQKIIKIKKYLNGCLILYL